MANEVTPNKNELPAHLANYAKKSRLGNIDATDQVIPRIKLMQAISPELQEYNDAKAGTFWHTVASESLGDKLTAIPIVIRKSYILWSPRNDERGILARAMDGIHWDAPDAEFTVKPKGSPGSVTYYTRSTVAESGLDKFGSSIPGDPQSLPAASLTYNMLWYLPDFPHLSPSVIINTRSSVKPMQQLISKIESKPIEHYVQQYVIGVVQQKGAEGPFFNYTYTAAGFADELTAKTTQQLYERYAEMAWVANEETSDTADDGRGGGATFNEEKVAGKF
jgi:hypothetical protein